MDTQEKNVRMESFPDRLAKSIDESGLGRPEFAARSGVGTSALAKWLSGKLTPKSEQLYNLAKTAGVTMEWLLTGRGERTVEATLAGAEGYMGQKVDEKDRPHLLRLLEMRDANSLGSHMAQQVFKATPDVTGGISTVADLRKQMRAAEAKLKKLKNALKKVEAEQAELDSRDQAGDDGSSSEVSQ